MPDRPLQWTFGKSSDVSRLSQIRSLAQAEPLGSVEFLMHTGLMAFAATFAAIGLGEWWFLWLTLIYLAALYVEKVLAARGQRLVQLELYWWILGALFLRSSLFNVLVVFSWSLDGEIFQFAAAALLVAATINIFVYHATHFEIISVVIIPVWFSYVAIAVIAFSHTSDAQDIYISAVIAACIAPYFLLALRSVLEHRTEHEMLDQSLKHSQKVDALGQLVAGVAHDFNNIMTVTRGNAELLTVSTGTDRSDLIADIIRASDRGANLTQQLLAFGRKSTLVPEEVDVAEFLQRTETMLRRVVPENIDLSFDLSQELPRVTVDRSLLETALVNLVINAKDAVAAGGRIRIEAASVVLRAGAHIRAKNGHKPNDFVAISVVDDGEGIPAALQDKVFDPFVTTKPVGMGTGLGLSMVVGFAEQSAGRVVLDSKKGHGTRVSMYLPAVGKG